ncbi:Protein fdhD [Rhodothermus marinus SG0.5JP17-172]|jgi:FdhD protein|uniref:formate dehydrogenase accessory sulfurtransferase FdhD n=1 Tax=Rhodothermus marinus TaxID=29549 RepID=UPI000223DA15|nr:formate dehydrogenase accessory sulfurtransferase FdhD [Rhodothermus marinus]AEN73518.1 Protein fdhD [Rhodothermus marinus SG0.5JP17-172]MBO2491187.1 formate dehydrogenase accessory sulfurtransferase FdhD [Rhodothermus marinus]
MKTLRQGTRIDHFEALRFENGAMQPIEDAVVVEEPLELRLVYFHEDHPVHTRVAVTMRTPGNDVELAIGFLFGEGIIQDYRDIDRFEHTGPSGDRPNNRNILTITLKPHVSVDAFRMERHFFTSASCGLCGKAALETVRVGDYPPLWADGPLLTPERLWSLPRTLRQAQTLFNETGGLHAAALFDAEGHLLALREDVGRHNALDKLIGHFLLEEKAAVLRRGIVLLSGRASFELVQKAAKAGIPVVAAVGAPSSLAVDLARECGMTLIGFLREGRFNVYSAPHRMVYALSPSLAT